MADDAPEYPPLRLRVEIVVDVSPAKVGETAALLRSGLHPGLSRFSDAAWGIGRLVSLCRMDDVEWRKGELASQEADIRSGAETGARTVIAELSALWKAADFGSGNCTHRRARPSDTVWERENCPRCQARLKLREILG